MGFYDNDTNINGDNGMGAMTRRANSTSITQGPKGGIQGGTGILGSPLMKSPAFGVVKAIVSDGSSVAGNPSSGSTNAVSDATSTPGGSMSAGGGDSMGSSKMDSLDNEYSNNMRS